ncbi:MAG: NAD(P)H-dependent oxidoreductase [Lentisphaeria bacterium]|nr:NAD(P)H-dependent oxidoreductase [Lentisphaeria bacterium]
MDTLVIYCHPCQTSHCRRILDALAEALDASGADYEVVDLYAEGFEPRLSPGEYEMIARKNGEQGQESDIQKLQEKVSAAGTLVFIYPVWWYSVPAVLKGFLDRVFTSGFAYRFLPANAFVLFVGSLLSHVPGVRYLLQTRAAEGLLKDKRAFIFRSYGGPPMGQRIFGNTVSALENSVLRFCGLTDITIHELHNTATAAYTQQYEDRYMEQVRKLASQRTHRL